MEYYSTQKKNEITTLSRKWTDLKWVLSEATKSQKGKKNTFLLHIWIFAYNVHTRTCKQMYMQVQLNM